MTEGNKKRQLTSPIGYILLVIVFIQRNKKKRKRPSLLLHKRKRIIRLQEEFIMFLVTNK